MNGPEAGEADWVGTDLIIEKYLGQLFGQNNDIDTILLACTHYPILYKKFIRQVGSKACVLDQGPIIARKLKSYLTRHPEVETRLAKRKKRFFLTTDTSERFDRLARIFYGASIHSKLIFLDTLCS